MQFLLYCRPDVFCCRKRLVKRYKLLLSVAILTLSASEAALSQEPRIADCPALVVACPDRIAPGVKFVANLSGAALEKVNWKWSVVGGSIYTGQGTPSILVTPTSISSLTASVEVGGLPLPCVNKASCTIFVEPVPPARKFDEYNYRSCKTAHQAPSSKRKAKRRCESLPWTFDLLIP
jgi:hypothetical protein